MIFSDETLWEESRDTEPRLSLLRLFSLDVTWSDDDRCLVRPLLAPLDGNRPLSLHHFSCSNHRRSTSGSSLLSIAEFQRTSVALSSNIGVKRQAHSRSVSNIGHRVVNGKMKSRTNPDLNGMTFVFVG
jgi:hypothetical protein